jgi:hypothetical protein
MFLPMWSSSGAKRYGQGNCCLLLLIYSPLSAHVCSRWWVVFPPVVCYTACLGFKCLNLMSATVISKQCNLGLYHSSPKVWTRVPHGTVMSSLSVAVFNSDILSLIVTKSSARDFHKIRKCQAYLGCSCQDFMWDMLLAMWQQNAYVHRF